MKTTPGGGLRTLWADSAQHLLGQAHGGGQEFLLHIVRGIVIVFGLLHCTVLRAQGLIHFSNQAPSQGIDAPIYLDRQGGIRLEGGQYQAQLYVAPSGSGSFVPAGFPTSFQSGAAAGYVTSTTFTLPGVVPGQPIDVQVRAWDTAFGSTYEAAVAAQGYHGSSDTFTVVPGGPGPPPTTPFSDSSTDPPGQVVAQGGCPGYLCGLTSFNIGGPSFTLSRGTPFLSLKPTDLNARVLLLPGTKDHVRVMVADCQFPAAVSVFRGRFIHEDFRVVPVPGGWSSNRGAAVVFPVPSREAVYTLTVGSGDERESEFALSFAVFDPDLKLRIERNSDSTALLSLRLQGAIGGAEYVIERVPSLPAPARWTEELCELVPDPEHWSLIVAPSANARFYRVWRVDE
jgi:hypothetical protein